MLKVESIHWKSSQPLTEDYIRHYELVEALFDYNPWDASSWEERAGWLDNERQLSADRGELAAALSLYNKEIGNAPEALQSISLLNNERTLCIVGGQQAGLFTGQALVIYKAVTLIRTAKDASARLGRPVVPVFWIAGEDHDFDEVNHMYYLSQDAQVNKIKLEHPSGVRSSVSQLLISGKQWEEALEQLDASLIPTEFKAEWMSSLRTIASKSRSLVDFFARMMAKLFGSHGLVVMNSDDPNLRRLESSMFRKLLEEHEAIQAAVHKGKEKVESQGYSSQVELQERNANLFVIDGDERILLYADEASDGFTDRKRERSYSRKQLLDWAESAPERLSNNVMTRPLMQDFLFPVLGTVLGPGEVAYWALTREAFRHIGMKMPVVVPRMEFTLLEGIVQKNMVKYGLSLEDVLYRLEEKQQEWLREQDALKLDEKFGRVKEQFKDSYQPLVELISGINAGLGKLGETNMGKILEQIDFLENKAADAVRTQFDSSLRQFQRIGLSVLPLDKPQERVYNILAYLNKYGTGWLYELLDGELEPDGMHKVIYL
ncbi:bacillithiol biosynthesis cysteine-adding enzyme BshC [Paenibacillus radicis (ex Xue et al. 2023)]|uniref:Putative cysteine ligase BshC n=1 Tax=Paenibacillus radicis (ex Xue et al. 2023) TaxID=2972489 RepID=A0ABT1YP70_9BACL|nr:bacillithiol biosynthesis cysteine-adding enzyme BshC [Paenibacillus radicis (ex Xue et al. 2023)]MCR8634976.1 bacillithiol biosynthesis cysteine-adding enzyme BshC [Paenibacillus radicis (ex Xue et al. 2023)]